MEANNEQIATFAALTGAPPSEAAFYLQTYANNLEMAVNEYFLSQEEGHAAPHISTPGYALVVVVVVVVPAGEGVQLALAAVQLARPLDCAALLDRVLHASYRL